MIFEIIFLVKDIKILLNIFHPYFVYHNKTKYRIVYKSKTYPLQSQFNFGDIKNEKEKIIIKLICYYNNPNMLDWIKYCESFYAIYVNKKDLKYYNNYISFLKLYDKSKMVYRIDPNTDEIQIFDQTFINYNKYNCLILYKDKILPLKVYFLTKDIEKGDNKLELYLIELKEISNKSYMFSCCNLLEECIMFEDRKTKFSKSLEKNEKKRN